MGSNVSNAVSRQISVNRTNEKTPKNEITIFTGKEVLAVI